MNFKELLKSKIADVLKSLFQVNTDMIPITYPDQKEFGDYATTVAMVLARELKKNPREIAGQIVKALETQSEFKKIEIAGPGFINFFISDDFFDARISDMAFHEGYGKNNSLQGKKILLEFVSANPTGPLHIGHGRWAAIGSSMANLLTFCGAETHTEFYINDAGNQINLLYESVDAVKKGNSVPENGYHGAYIHDLAKMPGDPALNLLGIQQKTLGDFRVHFDRYYSEKSLHASGAVTETLDFLKKTGHAYEQDGALWFKTTEFGDDKDRVLVKSGGEYTYFAVDIAYHKDKVGRELNTLINVLGADHHGYVKRLEAAVAVCSKELSKSVDFKVVIGQLVSLYREGEPVRMSKRTGDMITLQEVMEEIGVDAARYFLVMRKADTALDFDIEVAKKKSDDNPVFYVQYAFARISSILRNYTGELPTASSKITDNEEARDLALHLVKFQEIVTDSAVNLEPHRIPMYLENLAALFHRFYNHHRVLTDDKETTEKRLVLIQAAKNIIRTGLALIGVESPEKM